MIVLALGGGGVFVGVTTAANAAQQLAGALGLAIFTAVATSRTNHLLTTGAPVSHALTSGFQRASMIGSIFILAAGVIALRARNTRGETAQPSIEAEPEASLAA